LRRAAERGGDLRYGEIVRKFYHLPRSAFPELRVARAAISRAVDALVRRRLAKVVRYVKPKLDDYGNRLACINLTAAGFAVARLSPPSRTLPRAKRHATTLESMPWKAAIPILQRQFLDEYLDTSGVRLGSSELSERIFETRLSEREIEQVLKAARRRRAASRRGSMATAVPPKKKPLNSHRYSRERPTDAPVSVTGVLLKT
jgi:hypothetical protein